MTDDDPTTHIQLHHVHPCAASLRDYALGRLPEAELTSCAAHLETCPSCRQFVETVPSDAFVDLVQKSSHEDSACAASAESTTPLRLHRGFELIEELGRGGMAVVYKARQLDLGRIVAFKQIRHELMTADGLLRFQAEAGVIARIQHPNIVQIHDVGEQNGMPYIAFEFVHGGGLDRQLSGNPLPVRAACRLLATLARAIQVAHDQSIIHRDLKPPNVLLAWESDLVADPSSERFWECVIPKIGDFGLAKHLGQLQGQTYTGQVLGTPGYMSPEQARGSNADIAAATDIFALGVMFYETLTGRRPFLGTTVVQTLDLICTAEPVPPGDLQPGLAEDLSVICLKCLEKEPQRRYETAAELADDLERWLAGEPIRARPVAAWERAWKWLKRNPAKGVAIVGCAVVLCSLTFGVLLHNRRLQAAVTRANLNEGVALANFRRGHDVVQKMIEDVADVSVNTETWRLLRENLYSRAREYHQSALEGADDSNPDVRLAKTMALIYQGSILVSLDENREAIHLLDPARRQLASLLQQSPENAEVRSNLARCDRNLGWAYTKLADFQAAEKYYGQAFKHLNTLVVEKPDDLDFRRRLAGLHGNMGAIYFVTERRNLAEQSYRRSTDLWRSMAEDESFSDSDRARYGRSCLDVAIICLIENRMEESESWLKENEQILTPASGRSSSLAVRNLLAETYWHLSKLAVARHQTDLALIQADKAIKVINDVLSQEPLEEVAQEALARYKSDRVTLIAALGTADNAPPDHPEAIDFAESERIAATLLASVREHTLQNRWQAAETALKELETKLQAIPKNVRSFEAGRILADAYFEWAELSIGLDRFDDAIANYDHSIETLTELLTQNPDDVNIPAELSGHYRLKAWHLSRAGRTDSAFASWDLAIHYAVGEVRNFTQAERALERALLGDHAGATQEADQIATRPVHDAQTAVHLARVYSCCINVLEQDARLTSTDRNRLRTTYATAAIKLLDGFKATYFADPERRNELIPDPQLESLRTTPEFQKWIHAI